MSTNVGDGVLDWMLRRLHQAVRIQSDLVLVHDSPALADVGPSIDVRGEPWRVARVTGEITLRDALPEADRLIGIVPAGFPPLPLDIAGRTYLNRILDVRAEDVVAALSGRFCEALVDEAVASAVFDSLETLRRTAGRWSLGELVTAREVRSVLVGAELGAARLDRERDWELLARWIRDGAPTFRATSLVRSALEEARPRTGRWLAWALTEGTPAQLCSAGALFASPAGAAQVQTLLEARTSERAAIVDLVDSALHEVWRRSPARARDMLVEAERVARQVELDPAKHRLLRVPLEGALASYAAASAKGTPPDDDVVESLRRNLHAPDLAASIELVADIGRLTRFGRAARPASTDLAPRWFAYALRDVAWGDLAFRRVRRALESTPPWLGDHARAALSRYTALRDDANLAFAETLAAQWPTVVRNSDARQPLPLHQLTRCIVRRLVDDGHRVLLLVLDGCDVTSFLEIVDQLPAERRIGLVLPEIRDAVLRDDLAKTGPLTVAVSLVPTVTSHARRALFAGEVPGNAALDDTEAAVANATADKTAWDRNRALGDIPRRLFLKGDLGTDGQALVTALRTGGDKVLAAVFNGVDDALSSKETTTLPPWSLALLGAGVGEALQVAVDGGWTVVVTADHGHTPFIAADRKAAHTGLGNRFSAEPLGGAVEFRQGPLPRQPLYLLAKFGSWIGHQRRGFHGGAGIEEVAVPLAFLGRVRGEQEGRARPPTWWWTGEDIAPSIAEPLPPPASRAPPPRPAATSQPADPLDPRLDTLTDEEKFAVRLVKDNESVRLTVLAKQLRKTDGRAAGFMQLLVRKLFERGYPCVVIEALPDSDKLYRYQPVEGSDR